MKFENKAVETIFKAVANLAIAYARSTGKFSTQAVNHILTTHYIRPDLLDELHEYVYGQIQACAAEESFEAHQESEAAKYDMRDPTDPNAHTDGTEYDLERRWSDWTDPTWR
jgi:hypothetical protein